MTGFKHMKKHLRPMLSLALAACMLCGMLHFGIGTAAAASSEKLDSLKAKASDLAGQEDDLQGELNDLTTKENSCLDQKAVLEQKISVVSQQIANSQAQLDEYAVMIADKQTELEAAQEKEEEYYQLFLTRFRDMEENDTLSYWSIVFSAVSFSDLLDRISFVADVIHYDNQIVDQLCEARDEVAAAKADLEEEQAAEEAVKSELEAQEAELASDESAVEAAIAEIEAQSDVYAAQLAEIESQEDALDEEIAEAQAEYDAAVAAEEAAKKAEEEAAAKKAAEEEAAKKAAAQQQSTSNSSSNNSSSSSSGTARISMGWPCDGYTITSPFGYRTSPMEGASTYHQGIDISASSGSNIYAAASGTVTTAGYSSARGNYVVISHGSGVSTVYCHASALYVSEGEYVGRGTVIAAVGSTGISTGPHLHFSVIEDGVYVDPMIYVG